MSAVEAAIQVAVEQAVQAQMPKIVEAITAAIPAGGGGGGGGMSQAQLLHAFRQVKVETKAESVAALQTGGAPTGGTAPTGGAPDPDPEPDKPITIADVMQKWSEYLDLDTNVANQRILIASVNPVSAHFGVQRMREISEDQFADSLRYCEDLVAAYNAGGVEAVQAHRHDFQQQDGAGDGADSVL